MESFSKNLGSDISKRCALTQKMLQRFIIFPTCPVYDVVCLSYLAQVVWYGMPFTPLFSFLPCNKRFFIFNSLGYPYRTLFHRDAFRDFELPKFTAANSLPFLQKSSLSSYIYSLNDLVSI